MIDHFCVLFNNFCLPPECSSHWDIVFYRAGNGHMGQIKPQAASGGWAGPGEGATWAHGPGAVRHQPLCVCRPVWHLPVPLISRTWAQVSAFVSHKEGCASSERQLLTAQAAVGTTKRRKSLSLPWRSSQPPCSAHAPHLTSAALGLPLPGGVRMKGDVWCTCLASTQCMASAREGGPWPAQSL